MCSIWFSLGIAFEITLWMNWFVSYGCVIPCNVHVLYQKNFVSVCPHARLSRKDVRNCLFIFGFLCSSLNALCPFCLLSNEVCDIYLYSEDDWFQQNAHPLSIFFRISISVFIRIFIVPCTQSSFSVYFTCIPSLQKIFLHSSFCS